MLTLFLNFKKTKKHLQTPLPHIVLYLLLKGSSFNILFNTFNTLLPHTYMCIHVCVCVCVCVCDRDREGNRVLGRRAVHSSTSSLDGRVPDWLQRLSDWFS